MKCHRLIYNLFVVDHLPSFVFRLQRDSLSLFMEVEHNVVRAEATKAPTCELMRGPMLLSKASASLPLLYFY